MTKVSGGGHYHGGSHGTHGHHGGRGGANRGGDAYPVLMEDLSDEEDLVVGRHHGGHGHRRRRFFGGGGDWGYSPYGVATVVDEDATTAAEEAAAAAQAAADAAKAATAVPATPTDLAAAAVANPAAASATPPVVGMNSYDPWRVMESSPPAVFPRVPLAYHPAPFPRYPASPWAMLGAEVPEAAASGCTVAFDLDPNQQLHVSICVDGQCYRRTTGLSDLINLIVVQIGKRQDRLHAQAAAQQLPPPPPPSEEDVVEKLDEAVETVGNLLVGSMLEEHGGTVVGGWWSSIKGAARGVAHAAHSVEHLAAKTVQKFKGPITMVATAAATTFGGPAAGAAAAKFTGPLIDGMANDFKKGTGTKIIKAAEEEAKTNPQIKQALEVAKSAVVDTAVTYALADLQKKAQAGDKAAQKKIEDLHLAASGGDMAAKMSVAILDQARNAAATPAHVGHWALPLALGAGAGAAGLAGYQAWRRKHPKASVTEAVSSGVLSAVALVAAALAGYAWWRTHEGKKLGDRSMLTAAEADASKDPKVKTELAKQAVALAEQAKAVTPSADGSAPPPVVGTGGPRVSIVGATAALATLQQQAANTAARSHKRVVGVVRLPNGQWLTPSFDNADDADDWFGRVLGVKHAFTYAAYFDKDDMLWPRPLNETIGQARAQAPVASQRIQRGIAEAA